MAWYLRKSISVGPIRFNLSKSGVGASVGVTGFRVGMRPNGSSYVHAGRYGLYMREELGRRRTSESPNVEVIGNDSPTEVFDAVSTRDLSTPERKELLDRLNKSYKDLRLDYLVMALSALVFTVMWINDNQLGMGVSAVVGAILSLLIFVYESKRRTIKIIYDFEADDTSSYEKLVEALNELTIWGILGDRPRFFAILHHPLLD